MKSGIRSLVILAFLLMCVQPAYAEPSLDRDSLRASMAHRVNLILADRGMGQTEAITLDAIRIDAVQPVVLKGMTFFAVKMSLHAGSAGGAFPQPEEMIILTDPTGSYQFGMVSDIATGDEAAMVQAAELTRFKFPENLAKPFVKGQGQKNVIMITDPFCPYCRQAYNYLMDQLKLIASFSLVHFPLPGHPGAETAAWIMEFAREEAKDLYRQIVDFAYSALRAPTGLNPIDSQRDIINQYLKKFPKLTTQPADLFYFYLKGKYEAPDLATRKELQRLRITGTPMVIIDGQVIQGFDQKEMHNRLHK